MSVGDGEDLPGPLEPAGPQSTMSEFAGYIVDRLFSVGLNLESARSIAGNGPAGDRIAAATDEVDELIRDIRETLFRSAADPAPVLRDRMVHMAHELQSRALDAVALLEQRAEIARRPSQRDYPAEIKRWRAFADEAERMARRWEQPP
jgi:hypothetical protein